MFTVNPLPPDQEHTCQAQPLNDANVRVPCTCKALHQITLNGWVFVVCETHLAELQMSALEFLIEGQVH